MIGEIGNFHCNERTYKKFNQLLTWSLMSLIWKLKVHRTLLGTCAEATTQRTRTMFDFQQLGSPLLSPRSYWPLSGSTTALASQLDCTLSLTFSQLVQIDLYLK
ncbi:hypothetical protein Ac2012v2_001929 [Leucoagaricus gongylophorus]